jgi:hypothetical protein
MGAFFALQKTGLSGAALSLRPRLRRGLLRNPSHPLRAQGLLLVLSLPALPGSPHLFASGKSGKPVILSSAPMAFS